MKRNSAEKSSKFGKHRKTFEIRRQRKQKGFANVFVKQMLQL
jgi:hypothetical protein